MRAKGKRKFLCEQTLLLPQSWPVCARVNGLTFDAGEWSPPQVGTGCPSYALAGVRIASRAVVRSAASAFCWSSESLLPLLVR